MSENQAEKTQHVVSASGWLHELFEEIGAGAREAGCRFTHFRDPGAPEFMQSLEGADVLVAASSVRVTRELLASAPRLRAVVCPMIGVEGFDLPAASELGILVANGQVPENWQSMAEATVMLILTLLYDLRGSERCMRENLPHPLAPSARMLRGKTVGLIGFGRIAQGVARRLASWEVALRVYNPYQVEPLPEGVQPAGLEDLLRQSDVVCVLAALTDETRGMLDAAHLRLMKPDVVLVNTARGGIIDEAALVGLARERPEMRIALDTFAVEPLPSSSPLRALPNAVLTPHMVGHTRESMAALPRAALENVLSALRGEAPASTLNRQIVPAWERRWSE